MYDRILVPTDGSAVSEAALAHAIELADQYDATLHALYVVDIDAVAYTLGTEQVDRIERGSFDNLPEIRKRAERATGVVADQAKKRGIVVEQHHTGGKPHREIAAYAAANDIDLVVMGSHGRAGVRRALLGSVTERTLRATNIPVLVVDHAEDDKADE